MTAAELHLVVPGSLGQNTGGYRYDRRLVEGLRAHGWAVHVHELPGTHPQVDAATVLAADDAFSRLPDRGLVLIDGLALPAVAPAIARHGDRLRLLALVHHPLWLETGLGAAQADALRTLEQEALGRMRGVLVPSRRTARDVAALGVPEARIAVVPPGTDPAPPARGSGDGVPMLLSVAIVTPRKGHGTLLTALAALGDLPWRLTLIGSLDRDPAHAGTVRAMVRHAGLEERVALCGEVDEAALAAAYARADLFVQASHHEGFGMAVAEALAHGLPVVATAVGAAPELVGGSAGLLVPPGDAPALAGALRRVLADAALRRRLSAGARAAAAALPTWEATARAAAGSLRRAMEHEKDVAGGGASR